MVGERRVVNVRRIVDDSLLKRGWGLLNGHRPEWEVEVAEGMDLSLVSFD
jgi:hypothetical protein